MKAIFISRLTDAQHGERDLLYRKTKDPRLRTRAQMILLSAERGLKAVEIAGIVRESEDTVVRWLKRYQAEGVEGLKDAPRPGRQVKVTAAYRAVLVAVVRRRPRRLDLPFSLWTLQWLVDYLAEQTGIRIALETLRQVLKSEGISRPQHKISSPDPDYAVKKKRLKTPATP
jgi:transposase